MMINPITVCIARSRRLLRTLPSIAASSSVPARLYVSAQDPSLQQSSASILLRSREERTERARERARERRKG
ncbi:hypothetical protein PBY51_008154 [Eleginops maclovinus]|uniref:Uncharacterized protein n=1 Tax=Eleginops maclovinus TaxID=56733 RepID=A0AAN7X9L0_ELEMC|nr:hypothetical protein PBY51_008154 [Eleginops maclovinus]